jgi:hypothetical protein
LPLRAFFTLLSSSRWRSSGSWRSIATITTLPVPGNGSSEPGDGSQRGSDDLDQRNWIVRRGDISFDPSAQSHAASATMPARPGAGSDRVSRS